MLVYTHQTIHCLHVLILSVLSERAVSTPYLGMDWFLWVLAVLAVLGV